MIKRIVQATGLSLIFIGVVIAAWALTPGQNTVVVLPLPATALQINSPVNGATLAGTVQIIGIAGSDWINVVGYDASNGYAKVAQDAPPSGNSFTLSLPTAAMANGVHDLAIAAYSTPPGTLGFISVSVPLTVIVNNAGIPAIVTAPSIAGIAQVGDTLTLTRGTWTNAPTSYADQWQSGGVNIGGATGLTYAPGNGDIGKLIDVQETATNGAGTSSPATSATVGPVAAGGAGGNAIAVNDFLNSLGANIQCIGLSWCVSATQYTGLRWIRGYAPESAPLTPTDYINYATAVSPQFKILVAAGSGAPNSDIASIIIPGADAVQAAGKLLAVEGPNEPSNFGLSYNGVCLGAGGCNHTSWDIVSNWQRDLYTAVQNDTNLTGVQVWNATDIGAENDNAGMQCLVLNSTCAGASAVTLIAANTKKADVATAHNYTVCNGCTTAPQNNVAWNSADPVNMNLPGTQYPWGNDYEVTWLHGFAGYSAAQAAAIPHVTSETGWYLAPFAVGGSKIELSVYLSQFKRGYKYTAMYSFNTTDGFGWYNSSGVSIAPITAYMHNLTTILGNDTTSSTTSTLNYTVVSEPSTVHDLLLQKNNGTFELIVWDEQCPSGSNVDNTHNSAATCTQPVPTQNVTVTLGGSHTTVNTYDVTVGTSPVSPCAPCTGAATNSLVLPLTDHPYIIEVTG